MIEEVSNVADAYAQGLLQAGRDEGIVEDLLGVAAKVLEILHEEPRFEVLLGAPHIRSAAKEKVLVSVLKDRLPALLFRLLLLMVRRHRGMYIRDVLVRFRDLATEEVGRVPTLIQSAVPLPPALKQKIERNLETLTNRDLGIQWQVDPELLGGIRVSFEDFIMDGTIRRGLAQLRASVMARR